MTMERGLNRYEIISDIEKDKDPTKEDLFSDEQKQLIILLKTHSESDPITGKILVTRLGLKNGKVLRDYVNTLRCMSVPICANSRGYWYAENLGQVKAEIISLEGRISGIKNAIKGLENSTLILAN